MSTKRKTTEQFIEDAKKMHKNDEYIYTEVEYVNQTTPVCIICPIHGRFWQTPKVHLKGHGCPQCGKEKNKIKNKKRKQNSKRREIIKKERFIPNKDYKKYDIKSNEDFINYVDNLHHHKYDYNKTNFINKKSKVKIICHKKDENGVEHGEFCQTAYQHLIGHGCPKCAHKTSAEKQTFTFDNFVIFANELYKGKYIYKKEDFTNMRTKMKIICSLHGEFWQTPSQHLKACGCKGCIAEHKRKLFSTDVNIFKERAASLFHNKYGYDNVIYINNNTKVKITCPIHGDFLCTPANHLKGRGCPICKIEHYVYEDRLFHLLLTLFSEDEITRQATFVWLSNNKSLDFYISKYKIAIEHQGSQHFMPVKFLGGEEKHQRCKELDKEKYNECLNNNVKLYYFSYEKNIVPETYIDKVYTDEKELINTIKKYINYEKNNNRN